MDKQRRIAQYETRYLEDYGFEAVMVAARQRLIVEILERLRPRVVLEIGCGIDLLGERVREAGLAVDQWIIVEPGERFCAAARTLKIMGARVEVIRGFFEDSLVMIRERCVKPPDFIVCSGLLNEIAEPEGMLEAAKSLLATRGIVHVNVANAYSLHRRLARAMGIIEAEQQLTERNQLLKQYRVYDFESLVGLAERTGYRVVEKGGYFIKPFTHTQMESLRGLLSKPVLNGLWRLGRELPELAAEIYVNLEAK